MELLFVLVMLTAGAAGVEDLSGKMFTFPVQNSIARVKLITNKQGFSALTLCHRSFTDLKRDHSLFSMSTNSFANEFLIFWDQANQELEAHVKEKKAEYRWLNYKPSTWHSVCVTWDSGSGLVQMWFNGQPLVKKYLVTGRTSSSSSSIILGQEQDSHGGSFDSNQAFIGMMSDVHMWDYTLSACEIQKYTEELSFTPGNVLNWAAMEYQIIDKVILEEKVKLCQ